MTPLKPLLILTATVLLAGSTAAAQSPVPLSNQLTLDSFTGVYHLSRDSRGLSLLTTEETIVADFPAGGLSGIRRELPANFQSHSAHVKILDVEDAAGNPVPYKTTTDNGNLLITTGDPSITLYGSQTFKIRYQTSDVINLGPHMDEFLLDVNGRGWDVPMGNVSATLYLPDSFRATLQDRPLCYRSLGSHNDTDCQVEEHRSNSGETVLAAKTRYVAAHEALVLRIDFKPATFAGSHGHDRRWAFIAAAGAVILGAAGLGLAARKKFK